MSHGLYVLDADGQPVEVEDIREWGVWYQTAERRLARDVVGPYIVSTVFLGLDHQWGGGPPVLWETMVFDERVRPSPDFADHFPELAASMPHSMLDLEMNRYSSKADALRGHADMCDRVRMAWKLEGEATATEADHVNGKEALHGNE